MKSSLAVMIVMMSRGPHPNRSVFLSWGLNKNYIEFNLKVEVPFCREFFSFNIWLESQKYLSYKFSILPYFARVSRFKMRRFKMRFSPQKN